MRIPVDGKIVDKHPAAVLAAALLVLGLLSGVFVRREVVAGNVFAFGVPLAGLGREQAEAAIEARVREIERGPLTFVAGTRIVDIDRSRATLVLDDDRLVRDLDAHVSRRSWLLPSFLLKLGARTVMAAPARVNSADAEELLGEIAAALSSEPAGSRYEFVGRDLELLPPRSGQEVTVQDVRKALDSVGGSRLEIGFREVAPPSVPALPRLSLLAEFSTAFDARETDRTINLQLASQAVHGKVLMPKETYSFNREAGERTAAKGYRYANVVVGDHLEPGLAGGICQVTTTLFNAAALAGLDFPEVHAHGIPVEYVPPGRDAAVAWNYLDIKVLNSSDSPIVFGCWVENGEVTARVFGRPNGQVYELLPVIVKEYPVPGKSAGLLVETYRVERAGETEVGRKLLLRSEYLPHVPVSVED